MLVGEIQYNQGKQPAGILAKKFLKNRGHFSMQVFRSTLISSQNLKYSSFYCWQLRITILVF